MNRYRRRPYAVPLSLLLGCTALVTFIVLLVLVQGEDDSMPYCPVSHTGSVDLVPNGVRPCVLPRAGSGAAAVPYPDTGTGSMPPGRITPRPGVKVPAAPKAPAARAPAAPKAPAAPRSFTKSRR
ncbi:MULTISPECIES: hypothetical protein [unclassified Streptomyces]|uniref:hypothetical protein n=1 Tax=unclassified Streptomyces TaxID=2593676 RepID=UPI00332C97C7